MVGAGQFLLQYNLTIGFLRLQEGDVQFRLVTNANGHTAAVIAIQRFNDEGPAQAACGAHRIVDVADNLSARNG